MNKLFLNSTEKKRLLLFLSLFHLILAAILFPPHMFQKYTLFSCTVNINEAFLHELEAIPGLGITRARNIHKWRETNGPIANKDIYHLGLFRINKYIVYFSWDNLP